MSFPIPLPKSAVLALARRFARGNEQLVEEAVHHLCVQYYRGLFDPNRKVPLHVWAARVLRNYIADVLQGMRRHVPIEGEVGCHSDPRARRHQHMIETHLDLTNSFGADDLSLVRSWRPRRRFVLLGWHGLWYKLPPADQTRTLTEVRPAVPFPVPDFLDWADRERTEYLAEALRVEPNTVTQIRCRGRDALLALRFVRDWLQV